MFTLVLVAIVAGFGYWLSLKIWPYTYCRRCAGRRGMNAGSTRKRFGHCGACGGKGRQLRLGARLFKTGSL